MSSFIRPEILAMQGYMPGEQPREGNIVKLNTNENPYPSSPAVQRAIGRAIQAGLQKYPDPMATTFRTSAAKLLGVEPNWILCGNGSDDILTIITRAFVGQGERLRLPYPSYILLQNAGATAGSRRRKRFISDPIGRSASDFAKPASRIEARLSAQPKQPVWHDDFAGQTTRALPMRSPARWWSTKRTSILPTRIACRW